MSRHEIDRLSAYRESQLDAAATSRVAEHLLRCPRCRRALGELDAGIAWARQLGPTCGSAPGWAEIAPLLAPSGAPERQPARLPMPPLLWVTALLLLAVGVAGGASAWAHRPKVHLVAEAGPPTAFERTARLLHERHRQGGARWDLASADPAALGAFAQQAGLWLPLAHQRPAGEELRYVVEGAERVSVGGTQAVAVSYRVDDRPATLLIARAAELGPGERPPPGLFSKRILWRGAAGAEGPEPQMLAWTRKDQSYVLVCDLPAPGQAACLICHTDPERQALIQSLRVER